MLGKPVWPRTCKRKSNIDKRREIRRPAVHANACQRPVPSPRNRYARPLAPGSAGGLLDGGGEDSGETGKVTGSPIVLNMLNHCVYGLLDRQVRGVEFDGVVWAS